METIRDNPLTLAAKEQAAKEKAERRVSRGFNETTLDRAAKVRPPQMVERDFIRALARVQTNGNAVIEGLMELLLGRPTPVIALHHSISKLEASLPGLLLHLKLVEAMVEHADGCDLFDAGGLGSFFGVYIAEADELEFATRNAEYKTGKTPPRIDPDAPSYYKYEVLEMVARMAADKINAQKEDQNGEHF